ncbi:MAG: ABC transporter substrate-binding protein [Treponema sp.]|nr:ABC transporter substrate-binding protein [Treponema sp.]
MKKIFFLCVLILSILLILPFSSCRKKNEIAEGGIDFSSLKFECETELSFASQFKIEKSGGFTLLSVSGGEKFLLVPPSEKENPGAFDSLKNASVKNVPSDVTVLRLPIENAYLVSTSAMDFIEKIGAIGSIGFSGTKKKDWRIKGAVDAMEDGRILYAGKYSAPDYELLLSRGCQLAIENTMIFHKPEVKEKLLEIGIPVIIERSVYEKNPLGRLEWIKFYGCLFGKEKEAAEFFDSEIQKIKPVLEQNVSENTSGTEKNKMSVAFFYVNANGIVNVRKPGDYISTLIALSGGRYALDSVVPEEENSLSTMNMQFEDFYTNALDADIIIYNGDIAGEIATLDELLSLNPLFADFKAVREGRMYCTGKDFFQESTCIASFLKELSDIQSGDESSLLYLRKITR